MASLDETIRIILEAEDRASRVLREAGGAVEDFAGNVQTATQPLADLTRDILAVDVAAAAAAVTLGAFAARESIAFADSMADVRRQLDDTAPAIDVVRAEIERLALAYGDNANVVAQSAADFLKAGYDYETSAQLVETSTRFMIASQLDAETATGALNRSLAGFRVPADQASESAERIGDVINRIGDLSSGSFDEIVEGFARLAPAASDAGFSIEETAALIAQLVDVNASGEISARALRSSFISLLDPTTEAQDVIERLNVATVDAAGNQRTAAAILADLAANWGQVEEAQRLSTAATIVGKDQALAFNTVLTGWGQSQEYLTGLLDETTGAVGSMTREVENQLSLLSTQTDRASESWRQFLTAIGDQITAGENLSGLVDAAASLGQALRDAVRGDELNPAFALIRAGFSSLEQTVNAVADNLGDALARVDFSGLLGSFEGLGESFGDLFGDIDITTVEGLAEAIQIVVDSGESLVNVTAGIVDGLSPLIQAVGGLVQWFNDLDADTQRLIGTFLGVATAINTVAGPIGTFGSTIQALGENFGALGRGASGAIDRIRDFDANATGLSRTLGQTGLVGAAGAAGYAVGTVLYDGIGKIADIVTGTEGNSIGGWIYDLVHGSEDIATVAPTAATAMDKEARAIGAVADSTEGVEPAIDGLTTAQFEAQLAAEESAQAIDSLATSLTRSNDTFSASANAAGNAGDGVEFFAEGTQTLAKVLRDAEGNIIGYTQAAGAVDGAMAKTIESTDEAIEKSEEYRLKLLEIASDERIATIEAQVSLNIARLETDAQRVESVMDGINNTINSTGDLLGGLFGELGDASRWNQLEILDQIDRENELRQQTFDLQERLTTAEIARIEAQTQALTRGDALIQVDGTGLEPQLEAFMWEILKAIRVRANADFQDYLLGSGITA